MRVALAPAAGTTSSTVATEPADDGELLFGGDQFGVPVVAGLAFGFSTVPATAAVLGIGVPGGDQIRSLFLSTGGAASAGTVGVTSTATTAKAPTTAVRDLRHPGGAPFPPDACNS